MSVLLPNGVTQLADIPYTLADHIKVALVFLSYEELPKDERPDKSIWLNEDAMKRWWEEVERNRETKYGTGSSSGGGPSQRNSYVDDLVK